MEDSRPMAEESSLKVLEHFSLVVEQVTKRSHQDEIIENFRNFEKQCDVQVKQKKDRLLKDVEGKKLFKIGFWGIKKHSSSKFTCFHVIRNIFS